MKSLSAAAMLVIALSLPSNAIAQTQAPFVFVLPMNEDGSGDGSGLAWWLKGAVIRPMGLAVSGVSVATLNEHRGDSPPNRWCFASPLSRNAFVSPDRTIQADIDTSMSDVAIANFAVSGPFTEREELDAVVGNYQSCDGSVGAFLLITDRRATPTIVFLDEWENWKGLIWLQREDDALVVGSCFECGHAESLFYDPRRSQFYWQSTGD